MRLLLLLLMVGCSQTTGLDRYTAERCTAEFQDVYSVPSQVCTELLNKR